MEVDKKQVTTGFAAGVLVVLLTLLLAVLFMVYTGSYNIAATEDHSPFARWAFETTMKNSIERQAEGIEVPQFTDAMVSAGAGEYKSMCQYCHGGPGVEKKEWAKGMLPQPPHLPDVVDEWETNEIFWLVKHGAKMTGMPAFSASHDEQTLWNIVAFVERLPGMTAEEYARFESSHTGGHAHHEQRER